MILEEGIMETPNFYKELPENYKLVKTIDANKFSTILLFNGLGVLLMVASFFLCYLVYRINYTFNDAFETSFDLWLVIFFIPSYIGYIILHELTHGIFYKIYTHEKLKFGFNFVVAFCGVPHIYVNKKIAIITTLAPCVVYSVLFLGLAAIIPMPSIKLFLIVMFAIHFGGCIGDIYVALYLTFKNRGKEMLINDTGPKQTFYVKDEDNGNQVS